MTDSVVSAPIGGGPSLNTIGGIEVRGKATISRSSIVDNWSGGVLASGIEASLEITDSHVSNNGRFVDGPEFLRRASISATDGARVLVSSTTIASNGWIGVGSFGGTIDVVNSTVTHNRGTGVTGGSLKGTLVAFNESRAPDPRIPTPPFDCAGAVESRGFNLIANPDECPMALLPSDVTGDPLLGELRDDGSPGGGHYPLLPGSPAIDAGGQPAQPRFGITGDCPTRDQIRQRRLGPCDIGAIEFRPPTLEVSPRRIAAGETVMVTWSGIAAPTATDWIGLYHRGTGHTEFLDWLYVSCTQIPDQPHASGSCSYAVPSWLAPGRYELRLLANDQFSDLLATTPLRVE